MQTASYPGSLSWRTSLAGCASSFVWKVHRVPLNAVCCWWAELVDWISLGKFHLSAPTTSSFDESLGWTAKALTSDYRNWSFVKDFIKPKTSLLITVALQCMCSASASFVLKNKRNCHPVPFTFAEYIESLHSVGSPGSPPLLCSHHSSDGTVVSISLLWFP